MKKESIERAVELANLLGHVFIATADDEGLPHLAASRRIGRESDGRLGVSEWFCPGTLANLQINPKISIVVWDRERDTGYQILGRCEKVEEISMMDGLSPEQESRSPLPQVERKILVGVDRIIHFSQMPHSDVEE